MSNLTFNTITAKGIGSLPIYRVDGGKKSLDFNMIIPMPESLNINKIISMPGWEDLIFMTNEAEAIIYYLTDRGKKRENLKGQEKILEIVGCSDPCKCERWVDDRIKNAITCAQQESLEEILYKKGKLYVDNFEKYGFIDGRHWCWVNWGTNSNAFDCSISDDAVDFITNYGAPGPVARELSIIYGDITFIHGFSSDDELFTYGEDFEYYKDIDCPGPMHEYAWKNGKIIRVQEVLI